MLLHVSELTQPRVCLCAKYMCAQGGGEYRHVCKHAVICFFPVGEELLAQLNQTYWKGIGTHSAILFPKARYPGLYSKCAEGHRSSSPNLRRVWIRPTLHVISFDMVVLTGCTARIKKYCRALEGLTKSDFWEAAISFSIIKAIALGIEAVEWLRVKRLNNLSNTNITY